MPLSVDSIVQSNMGSFETSGTVSLPAGTTAGNAVIICVSVRNGQSGFPNGDGSFTQVSDSLLDTNTSPYVFVKKNVGASESSWSLASVGGSPVMCWAAFEVAGIGLDPNFEFSVRASITGTDSSAASSRGTGSLTQATSSYDTLSFALFAAGRDDATVATWSGYSDSFSEVAQVGAAKGDTTKSLGMAIAVKNHLSLGQFSCSASVSPSSFNNATIVTFFADGSKRAPDIHVMTGLEFGTASGMSTGSEALSAPAPFDTVVGSPAVVTTSPRTGTYCLELSSSNAAECVTWERVSPTQGAPNLAEWLPSTGFPWVQRFHVYFPTSLPSADVELASVEAGSLNNGVTIWFRNASSKIGVKVGTGTEQVSDATVAVDKWIGIDYRYDARNTTHTCDWQVDYDSLDLTVGPVAQTQASNTGMTVANIDRVRFGWSTSKTATVRYDDLAGSKVWGAYPLGDTRIRLLQVDPAGTPTVSGTSTNFEVFTSNGTGSAWNAVNARNAVDEVPPVYGSTADGVMQVTTATGDYVEFPMDTWTAAPNNVLRALRWYFAGWSATATTATIGARTWDGVNEMVVATVGDHGFSSGSTPVWLTSMQRIAGFYDLTPTRLAAMAARMGFSGDAAPDVGFCSIFAELAYQPVQSEVLFGSPGDPVYVEANRDGTSQGLVGMTITTVGAGATVNYEIDSVSQTPVVVAADDSVQVSLGGVNLESINRVDLVPG